MRPALVLVCLLLAVPVHAEDRPRLLVPLYSALAGAHGADTALVWAIVERGGRVTNPLLTPTGPLLATKGLMTLGVIAAAEWSWRDGHPRLATVLLAAHVALAVLSTVHNARVLRGMR